MYFFYLKTLRVNERNTPELETHRIPAVISLLPLLCPSLLVVGAGVMGLGVDEGAVDGTVFNFGTGKYIGKIIRYIHTYI